MASEIMSDPAPMMESDILESSLGRNPQGIPINQSSLSNFLKRITQKFQEFFVVQMNPQELRKEDTQPIMVLPRLPLEVVQEFQACLSSSNCDRLLEMVDEFPAQLFLQTFDEEFSRTALHVAALKGSRTLIHAMVEKLKALSGGNDSKLVDHDFIQKKDKFGLSATDMAILIANKEIISCFGECLQVFNHDEGGNPPFQFPTSEDEKRDLLEKAALLLEEQAPTSSDQVTRPLSIREWLHMNNLDFVYCLHKAGENCNPSQMKALEFMKYVCDNGHSHKLLALLTVRDSLGRSPFHIDYNSDFEAFFKNLRDHFSMLDWNMHDFSGRTPLHWAAAEGNVDLVTFLASQEGTNLNAKYSNTEDRILTQNANFNIGGVEDVSPLHLAVIHNHVGVVKALLQLKVQREQGLNVNAICWRQYKFLDDPAEKKAMISWTPIQLAAYMGHEQILKAFLEDPRLYDPGLKNGKERALESANLIPALHLAASQFHPSIVKALVDCRRMDILVKDQFYGNTALHYAAMHAHGHSQVYASLQDYVTVSHFERMPPKSRKPSDEDIITCIDILMQSGLDMDQRNQNGITPTLHPSCSKKVQSQWLEKMAKEAQEKKNNLIKAANAVSVTAALVATASFVGPLQPPLGLLNDGNETWLDGYSQVKHTSIEVFLFCDSLSFYLAIAAIVFAMLPSWPIPHEGLAQEVRIARRCVQVAILLLFGSIIFVVCAFSAASIAIVPNQRWRYKTIAVISTSLGVLICFLIIFLSFIRLLTLISPRNEVAKKISNMATQIILWERDVYFAK